MTGTEAFESGAPWTAPSARLRALRRWEVGVVGALVAVVGGAASLAAGSSAIAGVVIGAVVIATGLADFFVGRRVRAWGFAERDEDLLVRRGVMFRRVSVIPYGRMQYVDVTAGPLERSFVLATIKMHTAAAASDARIPGLPTAEAGRLRDQLTALGESKAAGL